MSDTTRVLAERLGMLADCEACCEGLLCPVCDSTYLRLPTEAEIRTAIFEAGGGFIEAGADRVEASVEVSGIIKATEEPYASIVEAQATIDEATPGNLVRLALLRALEACRDA